MGLKYNKKLKICVVEAEYSVICPLSDPFEENVIIYNRRVLLNKCKKCKYFKEFDRYNLWVICGAKNE